MSSWRRQISLVYHQLDIQICCGWTTAASMGVLLLVRDTCNRTASGWKTAWGTLVLHVFCTLISCSRNAAWNLWVWRFPAVLSYCWWGAFTACQLLALIVPGPLALFSGVLGRVGVWLENCCWCACTACPWCSGTYCGRTAAAREALACTACSCCSGTYCG